MIRERRVTSILIVLAMLLGIFAGLTLHLAEHLASYECTDSWMYLIRMDGSYSIDLRLQAGTLLQVDLDVDAGRVRMEVLDVQGRPVPVVCGWALIPGTGRYTLRFRGEQSNFRAIINCHNSTLESGAI